jgi:nucleoside-diphosphate-sugar epimerase
MAELKNVLVTGGSGRIGNHVVTALLDRGHAVVNFDGRKQRDERATFVYGDVRNRAEVTAAMRGCDVVCHLAEIAGPAIPVPIDEIFWGNARASAVVMQSAKDLRLQRIIYTSSCQVYGCWEENAVPPIRLPFDETHPLQPRNVYALGKVANEGYAQLVHQTAGIPVTVFRFPRVFYDSLLTPAFVRHQIENNGPTEGFETYVHVTDAARAYVAALDADRPGIEIYNIFTPDIASGFPLRPRLMKHHPHFPALPEDWPDYKCPVSSQKAWEHLRWRATWSFRDYAAGVV